MKDQILKTIYTIFSNWSSDKIKACHKGCAVCCTQNVTITALEGEIILRHILKMNMEQWFADRLQKNRMHRRPAMTTNDFARACLQKRDVNFEDLSPQASCPFLKANICQIYPARPFGCRMMISETTCTAGRSALVTDHYFSATTAVTQIVEHLGQKEYWGNMLDVLPALCDISEFKEIANHLSTTMIMQARMQTLTAKPLPGFLFTEEEEIIVSPLLKQIFNTEIEGKRIEDILNGKEYLAPPRH